MPLPLGYVDTFSATEVGNMIGGDWELISARKAGKEVHLSGGQHPKKHFQASKCLKKSNFVEE